jgi:tetratricopeptide (TPR) repeat protein
MIYTYFLKETFMKKIIASSALLILLNTTAGFAEIQTPEQAEVTLEKANKILAEDSEKYGLFNAKVAEDLKAVSDALFSMNKLDESIEYALRALKVEMKLRKENDPVLAKLYFDTGNKYYMHKQHPTAMLYLEKAAKIYGAASGAESLELADTYEAIASIYINLKDNAKALDFAQKCLDIRKKKLKEGDEAIKRAEMNVEYLKGTSNK